MAKETRSPTPITGPTSRPTNADIIRGHLGRPEQTFELACIVANRLHVRGRHLQEPSRILVKQPDNAQRHRPRRAELDRPPEMTSRDLNDLLAAKRAAAGTKQALR